MFRDKYLKNPKLAHLVEDIFWTMGFKSGEQCDKVHISMIVFSAFRWLIIIRCRYAVAAVMYYLPHGNIGVLILHRHRCAAKFQG